jgi:Cu+-exporting ATPase
VTDVLPQSSWTEDELLRFAASAERGSEHPLGEAIVASAQERGLALSQPQSFNAIAGHGIQANVDRRSVLLGNLKLLRERGMTPDETAAQHLADAGKTAMFVAIDNAFAGIIAVADKEKEGSRGAVQRLHRMGLEVVMLTGDNRRTAEAMARQVEIDRVLAEVLPDGKAEEIKKLQAEGRTVAMVGDGINDAPALAQADVGIAMGSGTDVAMEAADITLVRGDLNGVVSSIALSRARCATSSRTCSLLCLQRAGHSARGGCALSVHGWLLSPIFASLAMALSSVSVVTNALRLRGFASNETLRRG